MHHDLNAVAVDVLEPRFARPAKVGRIEEIAPTLKRVTFEGPSLKGMSFEPGQEVEFRVGKREFRHHTPTAYDADAGVLEVIFFLHGKGPGALWAHNLHEGMPVNVLGPTGTFGLRKQASQHVLLGDETALGLFRAMALASEAPVTGAIEVACGCEYWPSRVGVPLEGVPRSAFGPGGALIGWLERRPELDQSSVYYLVGHATSIVAARNYLVERRKVSRRQIRSRAFQADGKRGL